MLQGQRSRQLMREKLHSTRKFGRSIRKSPCWEADWSGELFPAGSWGEATLLRSLATPKPVVGMYPALPGKELDLGPVTPKITLAGGGMLLNTLQIPAAGRGIARGMPAAALPIPEDSPAVLSEQILLGMQQEASPAELWPYEQWEMGQSPVHQGLSLFRPSSHGLKHRHPLGQGRTTQPVLCQGAWHNHVSCIHWHSQVPCTPPVHPCTLHPNGTSKYPASHQHGQVPCTH